VVSKPSAYGIIDDFKRSINYIISKNSDKINGVKSWERSNRVTFSITVPMQYVDDFVSDLERLLPYCTVSSTIVDGVAIVRVVFEPNRFFGRVS